jgi:hypothetical protein
VGQVVIGGGMSIDFRADLEGILIECHYDAGGL